MSFVLCTIIKNAIKIVLKKVTSPALPGLSAITQAKDKYMHSFKNFACLLCLYSHITYITLFMTSKLSDFIRIYFWRTMILFGGEN